MKHYKFTEEARDIIARTGITQAEIARSAKTTEYHLSRKMSDRSAIRATTAWRIARAFATLESISPDSAFNLLFEIVEENRTPLRAAA